MGIEIDDFDWDEDNEAHCAAHGVWPRDLEDALRTAEYVVVRNRRSGSADYLFIGRDCSGRCIAAPIVETAEEGIWRPISAWPCKPSEERLL